MPSSRLPISSVTILGAVFLCWLGLASAQTTLPSPNDLNIRHKGPTGKPCLNLSSASIPLAANRDMLDQVISAVNSCGQRIKVNVCYYKTQHCILMDVPPFERKDAVLGILPKFSDFRFEFKEQFY
jgi:hypothetical protein